MKLRMAEVARELGITRRTLERAIKAGTITPTGYEKGTREHYRGHYFFDSAYVEELKCRANDARSRGSKYVMARITSTGTTATPAGPSASVWAQQKQWKRRHATRPSSQEVTLASALAQLVG